jgi:hypothetical protein
VALPLRAWHGEALTAAKGAEKAAHVRRRREEEEGLAERALAESARRALVAAVARHGELRAELARLKEQAIADLNGGLSAAAAKEASLREQAAYLEARLPALREADAAARRALVLAIQALRPRADGSAADAARDEVARALDGLIPRAVLDRVCVLRLLIQDITNHTMVASEAELRADELLPPPAPPAGVAPAPPEWLVRERLELAGRVPPAVPGKAVSP